MTAKALIAATGASDQLRALYTELSRDGLDVDASIAHHLGEVLASLIGRLVTNRTQVAQGEVVS